MKKSIINFNSRFRVLLLFGFLVGSTAGYSQFAQKIISESWTATGGQGLAYKNATTSDAAKNVYVAGATMSGANNSDIIVQKFTSKGVLIWEQTYAGSAGMNDAAAAIYVDINNNVYITGTVVNSIANDQDLIVLKYNSSGVLQWNYTYHGSNVTPQDAGTAITCDPLGNKLFVAGTVGGNTTTFDFKTFSLSPTTGSVIWTQSYDYAGFADIPHKLTVAGTFVTVIGASQESMTPVHWEMVTIKYNNTTGAVSSTVRSTSNTVTGISEVNAATVDGNGNTYIVGSINNPTTGYDIAVYKLDESLNLVWEHYYDLHGLDDKGTDIEFASGALYVTGYSTKNGFGKETLLMKLNSAGTVTWQKEISGSNGTDDQGVEVLRDGNRIYVAASVNDGNNKDYKLYCYDQNGNFLASASYNGASNLNDVPQALEIDTDGNVIITGTEQLTATTYVSKTVKYSLFERTYDFAYNGTLPTHLKGTMLVKFRPSKMKTTAMNSRKFQAGELNEFVDNSTLTALQVKTGVDWSRFKAYKVFKSMTPADSISITRLGNPIKARDFWTFLSIDVPKEWNIDVVCDTLETLKDYIREADPDFLCELYNTPNDLLYSTDQLGLYPNLTYPDADINAAQAWDLEVGKSNVKVGVLDAPINWKHVEFNNGGQNLPNVTRKIGGGYNYYSNTDIINDTNTYYNHGTSVAGIIGARRNNYAPGVDANAQGIAGIAGGNMGVGNFGVQLYSLGISIASNSFSPFSVIAEALHDGYSNSPTNPKNLGLNIINGSWGTTGGPYPIIGDQIEECWKNHCVYVAARGQFNESGSNFAAWPACFNDLQVINVIASGTDGEIKSISNNNGSGNWNSNYGLSGANNTLACPADVMAPGVDQLVTSTYPMDNYSTFDGTSAAAPHVTGVASLMYSKHQTSNGFPNNLSTEDIERIIEKTAEDKGTTGFDLMSGYGLVDAYNAVKQVSDPYYVKHLTATPTIVYSNVGVTLYTNNDDNFPDYGVYPNSKKAVVTWDVDVTLPAGHEIIDWWELQAANVKGRLYSAAPTQTVFPTEYLATNTVFDPIGGNHVHKTAVTATYLINGSDSNPANDFWYPVSPSELKYQFTVHVKKSADVGIEELKSENFILYPNPSDQQITVKSKSSSQIEGYEIVDATGRIVAKEKNIQSNEFTINVVPLIQGIYYCRILSENSAETIPFLKLK